MRPPGPPGVGLGGGGACRGGRGVVFDADGRGRPGGATGLVRAVDEAAEIGAVGGLLVNPDGSGERGGRRAIPNPCQIFCVAVGFHRRMPEHPRLRSFNREGTPLPGVEVVVGQRLDPARASADALRTEVMAPRGAHP